MSKTRSKPATFNVGDEVAAKWSGSNQFYKATIVRKHDINYDVQYEDGTVDTVELAGIKKQETPTKARRSPARRQTTRKSQSRSSSRSRQGRSSSRKRPSKEQDSKVRGCQSQSPSRTKTKNEAVPINKVEENKDQFSKSLSEDLKKQIQIPKLQVEEMFTKSSKLVTQQSHQETSEVFKSVSTSKVSKSDDENEKEEVKSKFKMGGPIGAFVQMLFLPALIVYVHLTCTKDSCSLLKIPLVPQTLSDYVGKETMLIYIVWVIFQALLACFPIGKVIRGIPITGKKTSQILKYRMNGFASFITSLLVLPVLMHFGFPLTFVYSNFFKLMIASIIFSFVFAVMIYIKSLRLPIYSINPEARSGCPQYDFFVGREIHPRIGKMFDLKCFVLNAGMISWAILVVSLVYKTFVDKGSLNHPIILVASCQLIYIANHFWHNEHYLSSATIQYEGVGLMMIMGFFTWLPFFYCIPVMYLVNYPQYITDYCLGGIAALFGLGLYMYGQSNREKYMFRRNPHGPSVAHLESIPTMKGKRLLSSGWWGFVRHPNYLGDIIIFISWTLPCGFHHFFPYLPVLFVIIFLVGQIMKSEAGCKARYGASWDRYTSHVQYRLLPKIF
ncbi:delta(14)-sterol reductase-like isoform X2 [Limulus polyphemus]|nr:delta(14)-sterol reductase-like isoform X2 [Limulus polyphemus]XP_022244278.1 delta(14)-sterol reductase-like isoform X2 [Limulus polyphemus]